MPAREFIIWNVLTASFHLPLHYSGADTRATDNSGMNPFMIAVEKGHLEVMKAMMRKDPDLVSLPMGSGSTVIHWALEKGHHRNAFFKVCCFISFIMFNQVSKFCINTYLEDCIKLLVFQLVIHIKNMYFGDTHRVASKKIQKCCLLLTLKETRLHIW